MVDNLTQQWWQRANEAGATMLEYALLAALISLVALAGIANLGVSASKTFSHVGQKILTNTGNNGGCIGPYC